MIGCDMWYPPQHFGQKLLEDLDTSLNEHLLFHGTPEANIDDILAQGLDCLKSLPRLYVPVIVSTSHYNGTVRQTY